MSRLLPLLPLLLPLLLAVGCEPDKPATKCQPPAPVTHHHDCHGTKPVPASVVYVHVERLRCYSPVYDQRLALARLERRRLWFSRWFPRLFPRS